MPVARSTAVDVMRFSGEVAALTWPDPLTARTGAKGCSRASQSGDRASADVDRDGVPTCGAIRRGRRLRLGLGHALGIGGTHRDRGAALGRLPGQHPLAPRVDRGLVRKTSRLPPAVIHPHLDGLDPAMLRPGDPRDSNHASTDPVARTRDVYAGLGLDRAAL